MNISIFDVIGPVMIGPSSSHTAGAARLARIAGIIAGKMFNHVSFGLYGSFARTYKGHGTDRALVAGVLGLREDDERLADAFTIASERGLSYEFYEIEMDGVHENTVKISFLFEDGSNLDIIASSIGGAQIVIRRINDFDVEFSAQYSTLVISQEDKKGVVSEVTRELADGGINIGVMRLVRRARGDIACCVIETDGEIPDSIVERIRNINYVLTAQGINIGQREVSKCTTQ